MFRNKKIIISMFLTVALVIIVFFPDIVSAAGQTGIVDDFTSGLKESSTNNNIGKIGLDAYDKNTTTGFQPLVKGVLDLAKPIATIMTAIAGLQIAFGISDGTKTVWSWILGIGLALSFADFAFDNFVPAGLTADTTYENGFKTYTPPVSDDGKPGDILSGFIATLRDGVIYPGSVAIKGICVKLLLVLFTINCSMKLALDLISGDKVKFLVSESLKAGFYIFLIMNWIGPATGGDGGLNLTHSLEIAFQEIGFKAGGSTDTVFKADSIWQNGVEMFDQMFKTTSKASLGFIDAIVVLIVMIVCGFLFILTSIEMFMVRVEFLIMSLICMPLLSFGVLEQLNFLTQKAIGAVFNLAIKVCVISFIQAISIPFVRSIVTQLQKANEGDFDLAKSLMLYLQVLLGLAILWIITKKIPELVSGLLSGNPSLSGASMTQMAAGALNKTGQVAGTIGGAYGKAAAVGTTAAAAAVSSAGGQGNGSSGGGGGGSTPTKPSDLQRSAGGSGGSPGGGIPSQQASPPGETDSKGSFVSQESGSGSTGGPGGAGGQSQGAAPQTGGSEGSNGGSGGGAGSSAGSGSGGSTGGSSMKPSKGTIAKEFGKNLGKAALASLPGVGTFINAYTEGYNKSYDPFQSKRREDIRNNSVSDNQRKQLDRAKEEQYGNVDNKV